MIPVDPEMLRALGPRKKEQAEERLRAGSSWEDHDVVVATHTGRPVLPRSFDRALELLIEDAGGARGVD